ncbi:alpha/beta hydrolase [Nonomuraea sp. 3-1Str]|uniref:alpha/beta hydrolase n=1 Tax=Nonomuraea sp. 3-1Str TaxID=2929801 RepID=UPI002854C7C8|nr:alpha/beta hydrolase [Nonomuraea sp. 3-1Str]MDR8410812.1 alpha/beta hydrolase [Nonomuraea sp. 3-1Str]
MRHVLAVAAALALSTSACAGTAKPDTDPKGVVPPISWGPCTDIKRPGGQTPAQQDPAVRCAKLAVPLDYENPGGDTIQLALIKVAATGQKRRLGSLVFNFGGPGGSGVDTLDQAAKSFDTLRARYDLISFDPRGVERSAGVRCGSDADLDRWVAVNTLPIDERTRLAGQAANREFARLCQRDSGSVLPYVGTVNAARDMDRLRTALREPKLNYFGMSYGTQLGAVYATLYPENVGRMVLDAPLDPAITFGERTIAQTSGFQREYETFLKDCVKSGCEFGKTVKAASANVDRLMNRLVTKPLTVNGRQLTQGLASTGVAAALYSELSWPFLEKAIAAGIKGRGEALMFLADSYTGRDERGHFSTQMSSFPAITCVDSAERPDDQQLRGTWAESTRISPLFGGEGSGGLCRFWPVPGNDQARHVNATGSAPIVVVGGKGDPATPYQWAPRLTAELKTARLMTYEGEGHGAYTSGNRCIQRKVDSYLLSGKLPARGAVCSAT